MRFEKQTPYALIALAALTPLAPMLAGCGPRVAATAAAANTSAAVTTVIVDAGAARQRLEGFGAATAYYQNWIAAHPNRAALYDALFKGLKLDILRLQNVYRPGKSDRFAEDDRDIVRGARESLGYPVTVMMSSWSPPADLKSNRSEKNGGTLARGEGGEFVYDKFADYWRDSLVAYRSVGIEPKYISLQNEPDFRAEWESCLFLPTEGEQGGVKYAGYDRALAAVHRRVQTLPAPPRLVGPETLGVGGGNPQSFLPPADRARMDRIGAVAHHLYSGGTHVEPDSFVEELRAIRAAYPGKLRFQTEFGRSDGFQTAWLIHNSLVEEEAHAYVYWAAIWPGDDALITIDNPWQRAEWKNPDGFRLNDRYYALKHYSYFTAPGYRRVEVTAADPRIKVSAFLSPDGRSLTVVALNTAEAPEAKTLALDFRGFAPGEADTRIYQTRFDPAGANIVPENPFEDRGALSGDHRLTLPPRAIATVTLQKQGAG